MRNIYIPAIVGLLIVATGVVYAKKMLSSPAPVQLTAIPRVKVQDPVETKLPLTTTKWVWLHTELPKDELLSTPMRESYVLTLTSDMKIQSTTDCNVFIGKYTLLNNIISVGPLTSTKKACPDSLESQYSKQLMLATSYQIIGDRLYVNLNKDTGRMVFQQQ